jgi:hypothetical protein
MMICGKYVLMKKDISFWNNLHQVYIAQSKDWKAKKL